MNTFFLLGGWGERVGAVEVGRTCRGVGRCGEMEGRKEVV